jgi:hypothetical protein
MKKFFFTLLFCFEILTPLQAQWCGRPCTERYYNPQWSINDQWYYGYRDINEYPYALPVNIYFNPCPSPCTKRFDDYNYLMWCLQNRRSQVCPNCCNGYHD